MLTRLLKAQLIGFAVITAASLAVMGIFYIKAPAQAGIGRYDVFVDLSDAGGLYQKANVTYRGLEVGVVRSLTLRPGGGVRARLQVNSGVDIPADAIAQVRSSSVIGEQYINFLPPKNVERQGLLTDGTVVPVTQTKLPTTTDALLTSVNDLLASVPEDDLRTTVDELGKAFETQGDEMGRLIDAGFELQEAATANLSQTTKLIDSSATVLATQKDLDPSIRSYVRDLDVFSARLEKSDDDLRRVLATGAPLAREVSAFASALEAELPDVLAQIALFAPVLEVYQPAIEHILTILPTTMVEYLQVLPRDQVRGVAPVPAVGIEGKDVNMIPYGFNVGRFAFKLNTNDPAPCVVGYEDAGDERSPVDLTNGPIPPNNYCDVPADDPRVVRGARNQLCPQDAGVDPHNEHPEAVRRGSMAIECGLVFDQAAVKRNELIYQAAAKRGAATYKGDKTRDRSESSQTMSASSAQEEPGMEAAKLLAPRGEFFLTERANEAPRDSLESFLGGLIAP